MTPAAALAATYFGLSVAELVIVIGVLGYVASLIGNWRPVKHLRDENRALRQELAEAVKRIAALEAELAEALKATDVTVLQREHAAFMELMQKLIAEVKSLDGAVRSNTAVVELIAKQDLIDEALERRKR